jgi:hypothetical protein
LRRSAQFDRWSSNIIVRKVQGCPPPGRASPGTFFGRPGGWLEVLEFSCFFRGISFCSDPGPADASRFAPGRSGDRSGSRNGVHWERFRGKKNGRARESVCRMRELLCALHKFSLTLAQINPEISHSRTGGVESYFPCLSRALSDRTCRAFYFPAHIADIGWQLRRSRPSNRTAVRNPAIWRTSLTVACSAVRRSRAL